MTATGTRWVLRSESSDIPAGSIGRADAPWECPYIALDGVKNKKLGEVQLDGVDIRDDIFKAADNKRGHKPSIRRELLEACNLRELPADEPVHPYETGDPA